MLPLALQVGIGVFDYWDLTYGEIAMSIIAYRDNEDKRVKEIASANHSLANLIGISCSRLIDSKATYPSLAKAFPNLFDEVEQEDAQDWRVAKARMLEYTNASNKKFKKEGDVK